MLSKLTLGTAQFGLEYGINNNIGKPEMDKSIEMLEYAYINGIRSVDTAIAYGDSEIVLGKWIERYRHDDLFITSKVPSITNANISKNNIPGHIEKEVYSSLEKLKVKKINNIMIHDVVDLIEHGEIIFKTLNQLKNEGIVNNIGSSLYDLESLDVFSRYNFDTIQLPGSIFNQKIIESKKLDGLRKRNVKVFVRSAFVQGLIFMDPLKVPKELIGIKDYLIRLKTLSDNYKLTISEIAMGYLLNHDCVDSIVFGVDSIKQLEEIIKINEKSAIGRSVIKSEFSEIQNELVDPRKWRF